MLGNAVIQRYSAENVPVGDVAADTTEVHSVTFSKGSFSPGDGVLAVPRDPLGLIGAVSVYAVVIDATHIGIAIVNASAGSFSIGTPDFDIFVFKATGQINQAV